MYQHLNLLVKLWQCKVLVGNLNFDLESINPNQSSVSTRYVSHFLFVSLLLMEICMPVQIINYCKRGITCPSSLISNVQHYHYFRYICLKCSIAISSERRLTKVVGCRTIWKGLKSPWIAVFLGCGIQS